MNLRLSVLTLIRSPLKTLITFALLVATSFAFVSRGVEFFTTEQVIADAESEYVAVGTLVNTEEKYEEHFEFNAGYFATYYSDSYMDAVQYFVPIEDAALDLILSSDYVEVSEARYVAGGVTSDELWNTQETPYEYFFHSCGTSGLAMDAAIVVARCYTTIGDPMDSWNTLWDDTLPPAQDYAFYVIEELLSGDPDLWAVGEEPAFYVDERGIQCSVNNFVPSLNVQPYDAIYGELFEGHRYVMAIMQNQVRGDVAHSIAGWDNAGLFGGSTIPYRLLDLTLLEEEKGAPVTYEDYAHIVEDRFAQLLNENLHKQELVYTQDMSLMPRFHDGTLYIAEGRALTAEDTGNVCVINAEYAERNGIKLGDTIDFDVDPNSMVFYGEAYAREFYEVYPETFALGAEYTDYNFEQEQMSYEVVGIWSMPPYEEKLLGNFDPQSTDPDALRYTYNTVFVPEATYPWTDEVEAHVFPSTFSFRLKHPGDMAKLEYELGDKLAEMGYKLVINDLGYSDVEKSFDAMHTGALVGFIAMSAALLLSLVIITYLFIIRRKSEYAIMRALGVSVKRASGSLLAGLFVLASTAIIVGCVIALFTSIGYARELAASMASLTGETANISLSIWLVPILGMAVIALLLVFAAVGLYVIGKKPPLALLQGGK